jgi:hypothetical protein
MDGMYPLVEGGPLYEILCSPDLPPENPHAHIIWRIYKSGGMSKSGLARSCGGTWRPTVTSYLSDLESAGLVEIRRKLVAVGDSRTWGQVGYLTRSGREAAAKIDEVLGGLYGKHPTTMIR